MRTESDILTKAHAKYTEFLKTHTPIDYKLTDSGKSSFLRKDVARMPAVLEFSKFNSKYSFHAKKLLSFSGRGDWECNMLSKDEWVDLSYDHDPINNDVQVLNTPETGFDFAILNQTFEHLVDPYSAIENIYKKLVSGGYFYANWPVLNIRHMEPLHFFTGLTVTYINYVLLKVGFEILECGTWGNQEYINYIFKHQAWPDFTEISLTNELNCPCIGWILARKP